MAVVPGVGSPLRFELLGPIRATRAGREVELGPAKQRAVLAVLLLDAGRAVPTSRIVDAVWGDDPPENGANVVQKYVAGLRRALDPDRSPRTPGDLLALTGAGYLLHVGAGALDLEQFHSGTTRAASERESGRLTEASRTLRHALGLWHGPALAGLTGEFFDAARGRLAEEHATAWEAWAEIELDLGRHSVLVPDLARLVAEFPLREGLRSLLMVALHQGGRTAEALAVFRDARTYFLDEFGAEPGEKMQQTHRRILQSDPLLAPERETAEPHIPQQRTDSPVSPAPEPAMSAPAHLRSAEPDIPDYPAPYDPPPQSPAPPPAVYVPPGASWTDAGPQAPVGLPPYQQHTRPPIGEMVLAALTPLVLCSIGSPAYFVAAGVRRRDNRQFVVAGAYFLAFVFGITFMLAVDPTPIEQPEPSGAETFAVLWLFGLAIVAAVHGLILAAIPGDTPRRRRLREHGRHFAYFNPERAREMGIGRPDLLRGYDDGGLVDVNHAPGHELARLPGISLELAHRITVDRAHAGPFATADDLVARGILTPRMLHRIETWVVAVPPAR